LNKINVKLKAIVENINTPTVIKTATLPHETEERLFFATQIGEIFYMRNNSPVLLLDIQDRVIEIGDDEEKGFLGFALHPKFNHNGLFYLHYSLKDSEGPGALKTNQDIDSNLKWKDREKNYDHIDTVEEWILEPNKQTTKIRTILNLRRPFSNHNGFNTLNFSPENGRLILTTGDGGHSYDPFNLSQNNMEIAGKIIEIDVDKNTFITKAPIVTRFNELPISIQEILTVIAKGTRNLSGVIYQKYNDRYIKFIGSVGQRLVESIFAFIKYKSIPVVDIVTKKEINEEGFVNFGWRAWEGMLPTTTIKDEEKTIAYYDEAIKLSSNRLLPILDYFHEDSRSDKFAGTALTGIRPYNGLEIPDLTGTIIFSDLLDKNNPKKGVLACTKLGSKDFSVIDIIHDFGEDSAYYVGLGSNKNHTKIYLGVNSLRKAKDKKQSTIYEIVSN